MDWSRMREAKCEDQRFWGSQALFFSRALVPVGAICYHIYSSRATIFYFSDTVHFLARSLTYEMLRWAVLTDHYFVSGLLYSPMSRLSLRTLRSEDRCSHLVITEQFLMPSFISVLSHWIDDGSDGLFAWLWLGTYYIVLWLSLLLYSSLWHVLTCSVMIWRS